jgi:hypothetical protein
LTVFVVNIVVFIPKHLYLFFIHSSPFRSKLNTQKGGAILGSWNMNDFAACRSSLQKPSTIIFY